MKKYIPILIILFYSCNSSKLSNSRTIPYIFPNKVTLLISNYLNENGDVSFLHLSRSNNNWILTFIKCDECENNINWIKNTNRKVYVNSKFYPLLFDSDEIFSIKETGDYLISSNVEQFNRHTFLFHNKYHIIFNQSDIIQYHGF